MSAEENHGEGHWQALRPDAERPGATAKGRTVVCFVPAQTKGGGGTPNLIRPPEAVTGEGPRTRPWVWVGVWEGHSHPS